MGIADDILIVEHNATGRDRDIALRQVMQICHQENLKLNMYKYHFRCTKLSFFGEVKSREVVEPDLKEQSLPTEMPPIIKYSCNYFRKNKLPGKVFTLNQ